MKKARSVFLILFLINLFNYIDRQAIYAVLPLIQKDLLLSDAQAGWLASAFMLVYMFAALPIGYLADRYGRVLWITLGATLWSFSTAMTALCKNFTLLFSTRAAVGIGESCYGAVSPSFVCEMYPPEKSGMVMALFSLTIPVGSALGYIGGGVLGQKWGWRNAFIFLSIPSLILAAFASRLEDPRGKETFSNQPLKKSTLARETQALFSIPSYALTTFAGAAMTFALGGFAVWMPSFFHRQWHLSVAKSGIIFGALTVLSGVIGSYLGGFLSERLIKVNPKSYFFISALGLLIGMPLAIFSLLAPSLKSALLSLFVAEIFLFLNMGPLNAIIVAVTPTTQRSLAFGANMLLIHALGDAISPTLIGYISDLAGLKIALISSSLFLGPASAFCFWGMKHYQNDLI